MADSTRRAVASYRLDATDEEKSRALRQGLEDVIAELIVELEEDPEDLLTLCETAIDNAVDDLAAEPPDATVDTSTIDRRGG